MYTLYYYFCLFFSIRYPKKVNRSMAVPDVQVRLKRYVSR